jgi:peptidoglycan biosynthesis protein MviN/MurJ (putative lipid II flippase)
MLDATLALNLFVNAWLMPCRAVLIAGLVVRPQAIGRIIEALLNLGLSIILARRFGLIGVALSTAIAGMLISCWYYYYLTAGFFRCSLGALVWPSLSRLILLALILVPIAWAAHIFALQWGGYSGALLAAFAVAVNGVLLLWWLGFDPAMRLYFRSILTEFRYGSKDVLQELI